MASERQREGGRNEKPVAPSSYSTTHLCSCISATGEFFLCLSWNCCSQYQLFATAILNFWTCRLINPAFNDNTGIVKNCSSTICSSIFNSTAGSTAGSTPCNAGSTVCLVRNGSSTRSGFSGLLGSCWQWQAAHPADSRASNFVVASVSMRFASSQLPNLPNNAWCVLNCIEKLELSILNFSHKLNFEPLSAPNCSYSLFLERHSGFILVFQAQIQPFTPKLLSIVKILRFCNHRSNSSKKDGIGPSWKPTTTVVLLLLADRMLVRADWATDSSTAASRIKSAKAEITFKGLSNLTGKLPRFLFSTGPA